MAVSPSSGVQRARRELAARVREIRLDARLTARALSEAAGWHESKTSRIESAKQALTEEDIRTWCRVCGAEEQIPDLIAASRTAERAYIEWKRLNRSGLRRIQESRVPLYEQTRLTRVYSSNVVPGFFQTPAYATALLGSITSFLGVPDEVEQAVEVRIARNRVLYEGDHRFGIVLEEGVLRHRIGDAEAMAGQLGHLLAMMSLPSVSLTVIPFSASQREMWPVETFTIFDDHRVHVELLSAQVTVTAPSEIGLYVKAFGKMSDLAVSGSEARSLITSAIEALG
ncbi:helix-turn-helix domain-containing protein [Actinomadura hibisca]|uniref:helix-turn-helix domain-containing protein n=1 Tax=Actinomadura hibisca TaxID=68565 RepID=UPI00082A6B3F|nr:helix-turn-helix transcriptional regulator [Actinomadura hibisca]